MNTRMGGLILAVALVASACGGASEIETEQAAQLEELEAALAELTEENEAAEQEAADATTTAPPTTEATTTTTEAPVVEEPVDAEPEQPTEAPAQDEAPAATASGPVGDRLDANMGPDEARDLLNSMIGPTDNMSGQAQRIDFIWPELSTLPGTEIVSVKVDIDRTRDGGFAQRTEMSFFTTVSPEDAVLVYQTELAALFPEESVSTSTQQNDDRVFQIARVGFFDVVAQEFEGRTFVEITAPSTNREVNADTIAAIQGLGASSVAGDDAELTGITMWHFLGTPTISIDHEYEGVSEDEFLTQEAAKAAAAGWTFEQEFGGSNEYIVPEVDVVGRLRTRDSTLSDEEQPSTTVVVEYRYS